MTKMNINEVAEKLETEPKTLRRFLRSVETPVAPVGSGHRYEIDGRQFRTLKKLFTTWRNQHNRAA